MNEVLIARWNIDQDAMVDPPSEVRWSNGAPATYQDYLVHVDDTHAWVPNATGIELHMFPSLVGDVTYDSASKTWVIRGVSSGSLALDVTDPDASDDQIIAALYMRPVVYRAQIHR